MPTADLNNAASTVESNNDSIVIVDVIKSIRGGRTLDVTGFAPDLIKAGHIIIKETATGNLKPMPVSGTAYAALPADHTYEGVNISTILKTKPFSGVMTWGIVNHVAGPYTITTILSAVREALTHVEFRAD